ncbi:MAG: radical SAM protein [Smithella sp.]|jgi:radical SAM superfamily enzyme YgiQ (UPF0313 family)
MSTAYDCYVGILTPSDELAALSSLKMATALGQVVLASQASQRLGIPSRVYNLDVTNGTTAKGDMRQFMAGAKRPLFGLTLVAGNVRASLRLAHWIKSEFDDATVIVGGPEITHSSARFLICNQCIDAAVVGNAEKLIVDIVWSGIEGHPNTYTRLNPQPVLCETKFAYDQVSPDYSLVYRLAEDHQGVSYLWAGDCQLSKNRCYFCARACLGHWHRSAETVWKELQVPLRAGLTKYYNTADTTGIYPTSELLAARPKVFCHTAHKIFINASQVDDKRAEILHKMNAWAAVGIESLSNLAAAQKGKTTDDHNLRAVEILAEHDVKMVLTFVLGLPGETPASLESNAGQLLKLVERYSQHIVMVTVSPLLVIIGSKAFNDMYKDAGRENFHLPDGTFYDPLRQSELYLQKYCSVSRQQIIENIAYLYRAISNYSDIDMDSKGVSKAEKAYIITQ